MIYKLRCGEDTAPQSSEYRRAGTRWQLQPAAIQKMATLIWNYSERQCHCDSRFRVRAYESETGVHVACVRASIDAAFDLRVVNSAIVATLSTVPPLPFRSNYEFSKGSFVAHGTADLPLTVRSLLRAVVLWHLFAPLHRVGACLVGQPAELDVVIIIFGTLSSHYQ